MSCTLSVLLAGNVSVLHFTPCCIYSLEWDEIQWRDIGDEGAIALADPRVFKNFKTLK